MKLVIHDLSKEGWEKLADQYADYEVISNTGKISPCVGCFGCWIKTPGKCVIKDEYSDLGKRISQAEELVLISKYTYGGFSSFVKNVLDRGISYMLPFFEIRNGEMHHKPRYKNHKLAIKVLFYGEHLTDEDKKIASTYVQAVALNYCTKDITVSFKESLSNEKSNELSETETPESQASSSLVADSSTAKNIQEELSASTILLNASMRGERANSKALLTKCMELLESESQIIDLSKKYHQLDELVSLLAKAKTLVIAAPLYVDGFPSALIKLMECMELRKEELKIDKIYFISNMGFYEARQIHNYMAIAEQFCKKVGVGFGGGLAVGAGEMVGPLLRQIPLTAGPCKNAGLAMISMAKAINNREAFETVYCDPSSFPRFAYFAIANSSWGRQIKANGLKKKDLYRK